MSENQDIETSKVRINEETGKRIYCVGDGFLPATKESDYCCCADADYSYARSYAVWVYPHGDISQKFLSEYFDSGSGGVRWGFGSDEKEVHIDDEWEYAEEEREPEYWGTDHVIFRINRGKRR